MMAVPSDDFPIYITGEPTDDYHSTLGKVFYSIKRLSQGRYKHKKWFIIADDDAYVHVGNFVNALSAFDSTQPW